MLIEVGLLLFSTKGAFTKSVGGGARYLNASISQQASQGNTVTEVHRLRKKAFRPWP